MYTAAIQAPEMNREEVRLMHAARTNLQAFAPIYERYFPRVYGYCLRRVGNEQEAEDLVSHVFTQALTHLDSYRGGLVSAWLFRIAHNTVVNHFRSRRSQVALEDVEAPAEEMLDNILQAEEHQLIRALTLTLSDEQQDLLALKMVGQLTSQEIGEVLGKSPGAVRVEVHRLMQHLRRLYEKKVQS